MGPLDGANGCYNLQAHVQRLGAPRDGVAKALAICLGPEEIVDSRCVRAGKPHLQFITAVSIV